MGMLMLLRMSPAPSPATPAAAASPPMPRVFCALRILAAISCVIVLATCRRWLVFFSSWACANKAPSALRTLKQGQPLGGARGAKIWL
jgi:hypothetical protein